MLLGFLHLHLRHGAKQLVDCGPYAAIVELVRAGARLPRAAPALIRRDIPWRELNGGHAGTLRALGRGIAGLLPIAFLFGSLLASADARVESFTAGVFDWDIATLLCRGLIFWVCLSLAVALITTHIRHGPADMREIRRAAWQTGAIEVTTVLAGLNLLFI